jgi:hypothetical protein
MHGIVVHRQVVFQVRRHVALQGLLYGCINLKSREICDISHRKTRYVSICGHAAIGLELARTMNAERFCAVINFQSVDRLPGWEWAKWRDEAIARWKIDCRQDK